MADSENGQSTYSSLSHHPSAAADEAPRRRPVVPWLLTAASIAFALGLLANPWFERSIRTHLPGQANEAGASPEQMAELAALQDRIASLEARPPSSARRALNDPLTGSVAGDQLVPLEVRLDSVEQMHAGFDQRLSDVQTQVADLRSRVDAALPAAAEGAERAQTVLLVTALRRTLDAGRRADALEPALRARFGASHPAEVSAVIALGRAPVTTAQLRQSLERWRPTIEEQVEASGGSWWSSFTRGLTGIVAIRRENDPRNPATRVTQASRRLAAGDVDGALAQLAALPPASRRAAAGWMSSARRHAEAMRALAQLEVAALTPVAAAVPSPTTL